MRQSSRRSTIFITLTLAGSELRLLGATLHRHTSHTFSHTLRLAHFSLASRHVTAMRSSLPEEPGHREYPSASNENCKGGSVSAQAGRHSRSDLRCSVRCFAVFCVFFFVFSCSGLTLQGKHLIAMHSNVPEDSNASRYDDDAVRVVEIDFHTEEQEHPQGALRTLFRDCLSSLLACRIWPSVLMPCAFEG